MSTDLLNEFAASTQKSWTESNDGGVIKSTNDEDEDFGDFEEPEKPKDSEYGLFPGNVHSCLTENRLSVSEHGTPSMSGKPLPSSDILNEEENHLSNEEAWGDFAETTGQSLIFDTDQAIAVADSGSIQPKVSYQHPKVEIHPEISSPVLDSKTMIQAPAELTPARASARYTHEDDDLWKSENIITDSMVPGKALISLTTAPGSDPGLEASKPPPSNIPPPSILLNLVTTLFQSTSVTVNGIISTRNLSADKAKEQAALDGMQTTLATVRAGARIIAGRKLRWKRDHLLSQSMKIGQVNSKSGGMKLTGIDKAESRREDQEAAEALNVWSKQIGPLRSAVSLANAHVGLGKGVTLPGISADMPIRVVKPSEGAVSAPKGCFLCGIRRDERIAKVDIDVEDSFGEWWTEHWGHIDCVVFWEKHKSLLPQR